jgi:hypothetical protein
MNIAVILTGHMRCWEQVFPNFKEKILDRWNPDVFIHTWDEEAYWDPHSQAGITENGPKLDLIKLSQTYKPKMLVADDFKLFKDGFENLAKPYTNHYHVPKNIMSMFYKIGKGFQLVEEFTMQTGKQYDMVMRLRPDLVYNQDLPEFELDTFYTLQHRNHMGGGTGDMIQIGNFMQVQMFSKLLCYLPRIYQKTKLLCPHVVSEFYIKSIGLPWKEFHINKTIMHTPKGEYVPKEMYQ